MQAKLLAFFVIAFCFSSITYAQKPRFVGTTWSLTYTMGRQNSRDYQEYAKVSFQEGGRCHFDDGETGTWTLKGTKLNIMTASDTGVHWIEARVSGSTAAGTAVLGMNSQVSYWIRLRKIR